MAWPRKEDHELLLNTTTGLGELHFCLSSGESLRRERSTELRGLPRVETSRFLRSSSARFVADTGGHPPSFSPQRNRHRSVIVGLQDAHDAHKTGTKPMLKRRLDEVDCQWAPGSICPLMGSKSQHGPRLLSVGK